MGKKGGERACKTGRERSMNFVGKTTFREAVPGKAGHEGKRGEERDRCVKKEKSVTSSKRGGKGGAQSWSKKESRQSLRTGKKREGKKGGPSKEPSQAMSGNS